MLACGQEALWGRRDRVAGLRHDGGWEEGRGAILAAWRPRLQLSSRLGRGSGVVGGDSGGRYLAQRGSPAGTRGRVLSYLSLSSLLTEESRLSTSLSLS